MYIKPTLTIISLIRVFITLLGCNSINKKKRLNNIEESYEVYYKEESGISKLMIENKDSALVLLSLYISEYPESMEFLSLRMALYFDSGEYVKCKADINKMISLRPDTEGMWISMLSFLDCKTNNHDKNCDSLLPAAYESSVSVGK